MMKQELSDFILPSLDEYTIESKIGESNFGVVYRSINIKTGKEVALKFIRNIWSLSDAKQQKEILRNLAIIRSSNSLGFLPIYSFRFPIGFDIISNFTGEYSKCAIVIMKYMKNGSLKQIVKEYLDSKGKKSDILNPTRRSKIIYGIAAIMKHAHNRNIVHRSLHLGNIFLDENFEPQISDFSLTRLTPDPFQIMNSFNYPFIMPPENLANDDTTYEPSGDVYSFAFLLFRMFVSKIHYSSKVSFELCKGKRLERPKIIPGCYWELIQCCWSHNPNERPTFDEITVALKDDRFAIEEFGMKTDLDQLHEYQARIDSDEINCPCCFSQKLSNLIQKNH